jgi:hypothetical protein
MRNMFVNLKIDCKLICEDLKIKQEMENV